MFVDLPDVSDLSLHLFSERVYECIEDENAYYILGMLTDNIERYSVPKCTLYSSEEFFNLPEFNSIKKLLTAYAVANVDGACFELSPKKKPLNYDLVINMAKDDDFAGEIAVEILEWYAYIYFKHVVQIEDLDGECYYFVERRSSDDR